MTRTKQQKRFRWQAHKPLLATALAVAGVFNMVGVVLAEGTAAGTQIENTATATYDDGAGNSIEAVSNTVTISVAEIAGLTVVSSGFQDNNGGSIVGGDTLFYDFLATNTGNAATNIFIPGPDQLDVTNGTATSVDIINATTGAVIQNIPAGGAATAALVNADANITVRVTVTAATLADPTGQFVAVQFGDTSENTIAPADSTQNQQNIPDDTEAAGAESANGVVTENQAGTEVPANGEREAAAFRQEAFNTAPAKLAQALLLKTSAYSNSSTTNNPADDTIVYSLELRVGNETAFDIDAGELEGTDISIDSVTQNRILVSDAIPANADFDPSVVPTTPNANWTVVYSQTPLTTNALDAAWSTIRPAAADSITRVGFVYNAATNGTLKPLDVVTGFSFGVITNGLSAPGGSVANVAQVFGETAGDLGNNIVYDESGDQRPNNLDDLANPADNTTTFDPANDLGIGNPNDPEETLNGNDGTGPNGESNVVVIAVPVAGNLFNGPNGAPSATGPTNTNDDFTNVSANVAVAGAPGTPSDPDAVIITNQVQNPAGAPTRLDTVTLLPLSASDALAAAGSGSFGANGDLPNGTLVEIAFGAQSTAYSYADGTFTPIVSLTDTTPATGAAAAPVVIGTLNPGDVRSYTVTINLPDGTAQVGGYGVPIAAFVDNDGNGLFTPTTETVSNITVDRVYTGFMQLVKKARVIYAERDGVTQDPTAFTDVQTTLDAINDLTPGDAIEYQIEYTNISEQAPTGGFGNVILNANSFVLTEDGTATINTVDDTGTAVTATNNWASFTTHLQNTNATAGSVTYQDVTGPTRTTDPADGTKVDIYENTVGTVEPAAPDTGSGRPANGSLTFRRQVR